MIGSGTVAWGIMEVVEEVAKFNKHCLDLLVTNVQLLSNKSIPPRQIS